MKRNSMKIAAMVFGALTATGCMGGPEGNDLDVTETTTPETEQAPAAPLSATADSDGDGLPDAWETGAGKTLGAKVGRRDVFIHVDWRACTTNDAAPKFPNAGAVQDPKVGGALKWEAMRRFIKYYRDLNPSWCVHIDNGETIWDCDDLNASGDKIWFNETRKSLAKARTVLVNESNANPPKAAYQTYFPPERVGKFYYGIVGCGDAGVTESGIPRFANAFHQFFHEFGHVWGISHGGKDGINYKPNYFSQMNYAYSYNDDVFFSTLESKFPLNEYNICEKDGIGLPLSGNTVTTVQGKSNTLYTIPKELKPLVDKGAFGVPAKAIGPNGEIDWNGDGVFNSCGGSYKEVAVRVEMKSFPVIRDKNRFASTLFSPALARIPGAPPRLWLFYKNKDGILKAAAGPSSKDLSDLRLLLKKDVAVSKSDLDLFTSPTVIPYDTATYGQVVSSPSVVFKDGNPRVYFRAAKGHILRITLSLSGTTVASTTTDVLHTPTAVTKFCHPTAGYHEATDNLFVVARDCATSDLYQYKFGTWTAMNEKSFVRPGLAFAPSGTTYLFGAKPPDANQTDTCDTNGPSYPIFVRKIPKSGVGTTTWLSDDLTKSDCAQTGSDIGAVFDTDAARSVNGRIYVFYRKTKPADSTFSLRTIHYDIAGQGNSKAFLKRGLVDGNYANENKLFGPKLPSNGIMMGGKAVIAFVMADPGNKKGYDGSIAFTPAADGVRFEAIKSDNDLETIQKKIPTAAQTLATFALTPPPTGDQDGDGIPDKSDKCPRHYGPTDTNGDFCKFNKLGGNKNLDGDNNKNGIADQYEGPDQDGDGIPDANDADRDGDGVCDVVAASDRPVWCKVIDNCPSVANFAQSDVDNYGKQADIDGDGLGDACDPDIDGDGVPNAADECPYDKKGTVDSDGDGVCDYKDNCVLPKQTQSTPGGGAIAVSPSANADQLDSNGDGVGNACEVGAHGKVVSVKVNTALSRITVSYLKWGAATNDSASSKYLSALGGEMAIGVCANKSSSCANDALYSKDMTWGTNFTRTTKTESMEWDWKPWAKKLGILSCGPAYVLDDKGNGESGESCVANGGVKVKLFWKAAGSSIWSSSSAVALALTSQTPPLYDE